MLLYKFWFLPNLCDKEYKQYYLLHIALRVASGDSNLSANSPQIHEAAYSTSLEHPPRPCPTSRWWFCNSSDIWRTANDRMDSTLMVTSIIWLAMSEPCLLPWVTWKEILIEFWSYTLCLKELALNTALWKRANSFKHPILLVLVAIWN